MSASAILCYRMKKAQLERVRRHKIIENNKTQFKNYHKTTTQSYQSNNKIRKIRVGRPLLSFILLYSCAEKRVEKKRSQLIKKSNNRRNYEHLQIDGKRRIRELAESLLADFSGILSELVVGSIGYNANH